MEASVIPSISDAGVEFRPDPTIVLPEPAVVAVRRGMRPKEDAIALREADRLLEPDYLSMENGFARLSDGILHVATLTPMPGVTGEMIDWWFAWHPLDPIRYQMWNPKDHVDAKWRRPIARGASWREVYETNVADVDEYVGSSFLKLSIAYERPERYLTTSRFSSAGVETAVCARVLRRDLAGIVAGHLVHLIRKTSDGVEMRSRFWLADLGIDGPLAAITKPLFETPGIRRTIVRDHVGRDLLIHCAEEMRHLAGFLPELFRRFSKHPL
jgi:hypothetical protein